MKYDYLCKECNTKFEVEQSMKAEAKADCPSCHTTCRNRLITGGNGFVLAGGGWYADSYNKKV